MLKSKKCHLCNFRIASLYSMESHKKRVHGLNLRAWEDVYNYHEFIQWRGFGYESRRGPTLKKYGICSSMGAMIDFSLCC